MRLLIAIQKTDITDETVVKALIIVIRSSESSLVTSVFCETKYFCGTKLIDHADRRLRILI